ncbi:MAG TPA: hypothetical protein VHH73_17150 [Verrucomicrobiae bacterium]|nr:hypothetical protein [Verrucomicrobiae bacterium]
MNTDALQKKLLAAARATPPGDHVPYAFERRIMARIKALPAADPLAQLTSALWRAAIPCVGVMVVLCAVNFYYTGPGANDNQNGDLESLITLSLNDAGETL